MRIEVKLTLCMNEGDFRCSWYVTASARVRVVTHTWMHPGETLVEDIEIDECHCHHIGYGDLPLHTCFTDMGLVSVRANEEARDFLNRNIDDWSDRIRSAVLAEHESQLVHA